MTYQRLCRVFVALLLVAPVLALGPRSGAAAGEFAASASVTPAAIEPGDTAAIRVAVRNTTAQTRTAHVIVWVTAPSGARVYEMRWRNQSFSPNQARIYTTPYRSANDAVLGQYQVGVHVLGTD